MNGKKKIKNILLLFGDQHRQDCMGCYGNPVVKTPNLDALAKNGLVFTNAFTPTAVCTPARTSLQSGLLTHKHDVMYNPEWHGRDGGSLDVPKNIRFFSEDLKKKNWQAAHVGKWHIGEKNKPADYGYEGIYYPGYGIPYNPFFRIKHYQDHLKKHGVKEFKLLEEIRDPSGERLFAGLQNGPQEVSTPAYLAEQAVQKVREYSGKKKPFFISCNFWGPHGPYYITEKHYRMYDNALKDIKPWKNFKKGIEGKPEIIKRHGQFFRTGWLNEKTLPVLIAKYYGYITLIDEEIGRIIAELKRCGEYENTIIIYSADHAENTGAYGMWDKGAGMYDCMYKVPFIISNPGIKPKVSEAFVSLLDLAPTFLDIAGVQHQKNRFDGVSLMPLITGKKEKVRDDLIICEGFGNFFKFLQRMVRTKTDKYIFNPTDRDEYYDLKNDPFEMKNIIDKVNRKKLKKMKNILLKWMADTDDPLLKYGRFLT